MSDAKKLPKEGVKLLFESKFIRLFDLQFAEGSHYYNATRRKQEDLMALKSDAEFMSALPDAVTCVVILGGDEPRLLLGREFRYPAGQFLISPPAGLLDPEDADAEQPLLATAIREIKEETGIEIGPDDRLEVINPMLFSSPGMTDESNALVLAYLAPREEWGLSQDGAVGGELFDGFELLTKEEALEVIRRGTDKDGRTFSIFTWSALMFFVSGMWE